MDFQKKDSFPVDLVYTWVNGNDPVWVKKRNALSGGDSDNSGKDCIGRYADNEELRYSLRSVEMYAPWIRKIFIITDNQIPLWLDTSNPMIRIVDHREILPADALPTFNSTVIEHALHNIPDLSEHFLYANDDMFFGREMAIEDFFLSDGTPIIRLSRRPFRKFTLFLKEKIGGKKLSNYNITIHNTAKLVCSKYGRYIGHKTHHNIDAYRKSDYAHAFEVFKKEITGTFSHHKREDTDIQRNLYSYLPIIEKRGKVKFISHKESFRCHIDNERNFRKLEKLNPIFFCLNDSEFAGEEDRRRVKKFLENRFPEKSKFEK